MSAYQRHGRRPARDEGHHTIPRAQPTQVHLRRTANSVASRRQRRLRGGLDRHDAGPSGVWAKMYDATYATRRHAADDRGRPYAVVNPATGSPWANNEILDLADPTATDASVARDADGDFVVTWSALSPTTELGRLCPAVQRRRQAMGGASGQYSTTARAALLRRGDGHRGRLRHHLAEQQPGRQRLRRLHPGLQRGGRRRSAAPMRCRKSTSPTDSPARSRIRWDDDNNPSDSKYRSWVPGSGVFDAATTADSLDAVTSRAEHHRGLDVDCHFGGPPTGESKIGLRRLLQRHGPGAPGKKGWRATSSEGHSGPRQRRTVTISTARSAGGDRGEFQSQRHDAEATRLEARRRHGRQPANFVVTWTSVRPGRRQRDRVEHLCEAIYAERRFPQGNVEFLVNADDLGATSTDDKGNVTITNAVDNITGNQEASSVAMDLAGNFVVSWTSYGHDGGGNGYGTGFGGQNGVFARRCGAALIRSRSNPVTGQPTTMNGVFFLGDATQASDAFQVNQTATGNQQSTRRSRWMPRVIL